MARIVCILAFPQEPINIGIANEHWVLLLFTCALSILFTKVVQLPSHNEGPQCCI